MLAGDFWAGIVNLVETLHAVKSFEALLGYIDATLAWRAAVWSNLPPCAEAYDIAIWKYRFTSDIAKLYMLDLFDIERAANPYGKTYLTGIVRFSDYKQWIDTTAGISGACPPVPEPLSTGTFTKPSADIRLGPTSRIIPLRNCRPSPTRISPAGDALVTAELAGAARLSRSL